MREFNALGLDSLLVTGYITRMRIVSANYRRLPAWRAEGRVLWPLSFSCSGLLPFGDACAASRSELRRFQGSIIDYRGKLNRQFKKVTRKKTEYIIVHTTEGGEQRPESDQQGQDRENGKRVTPGGHAHM